MWNKSIEEVFSKFKTNKNGLTQIQAEERLKINGKNEIPKAKNKTVFKIFIEVSSLLFIVFNLFIESFKCCPFVI